MPGFNGKQQSRRDLLANRGLVPPAPPEFKMKSGQVVKFRRESLQYVTDSPTATKFVSLLRRVDAGEIDDMFRLFEEMKSKDAHLQGVANTRENAITALEWEVLPETNTDNPRMAEEAAKIINDQLVNLKTFNDSLVHLTEAISTGVSVVELIWKDFKLVETSDVPGYRLHQDLDTGRIKAETIKAPLGVELPPGKFVVFIPKPRAGYPFRVTLTRAAAWLYLVKHFVFGDWAGFSERFGMPIPVGTVGDSADTGAAGDLETALANMMVESYLVLPEGCGVDLVEAARNTQPFSELIELIDKKISILWLGQTLTTEMQSVGSFAAANVHNNVRTDILLSDLMQEAAAVRNKIIAPMIQFRFPGKNVPIPHFKRKILESRNIESERLTLEQLRFGKEIGLSVEKSWLYESLSFPIPAKDAELVNLGSSLVEESLEETSNELANTVDRDVLAPAARFS